MHPEVMYYREAMIFKPFKVRVLSTSSNSERRGVRIEESPQ
jgi:hypothetical protein